MVTYPQTLDWSVATGPEDAHESSLLGYSNSTNFLTIYRSTNAANQSVVGLTFPVNLPVGKTLSDAYIEVTTQTGGASFGVAECFIAVEQTAQSPIWEAANGPKDRWDNDSMSTGAISYVRSGGTSPDNEVIRLPPDSDTTGRTTFTGWIQDILDGTYDTYDPATARISVLLRGNSSGANAQWRIDSANLSGGAPAVLYLTYEDVLTMETVTVGIGLPSFQGATTELESIGVTTTIPEGLVSNTNTVSMTGYDNVNDYGTPTINQSLPMTGYQNSNDFGDITDVQISSPIYENTNSFGTIQVNVSLGMTGYDNPNDFGDILDVQILAPSGYENQNAFGTITDLRPVPVTGYENANSFGTMTVLSEDTGQQIAMTGYQNPNGFGFPNNVTVEHVDGYQNSNDFGTPNISYKYDVSAYQNSNDFGTINIAGLNIVQAYQNENDFGTITVNRSIGVLGLDSQNTFGEITEVRFFGVSAYQNPNDFGSVVDLQSQGMTGYQNPNAFGTITVVEDPTQEEPMQGYQNPNAFGTVSVNQIIRVQGYQNSNQFGTMYVPQSATADFFMFIVATY